MQAVAIKGVYSFYTELGGKVGIPHYLNVQKYFTDLFIKSVESSWACALVDFAERFPFQCHSFQFAFQLTHHYFMFCFILVVRKIFNNLIRHMILVERIVVITILLRNLFLGFSELGQLGQRAHTLNKQFNVILERRHVIMSIQEKIFRSFACVYATLESEVKTSPEPMTKNVR